MLPGVKYFAIMLDLLGMVHSFTASWTLALS
jgi:hypothetical protein